ncbi:MAG: IS66 family transposase [Betaproteobacteria bacterium]|nr:IS66 family transposase [Betaproteobacteria bacterium]
MTSTTKNRVPSLAEVATLSPQQVVDLVATFAREIDGLKQQLDWFKRQVFGHKSERRLGDGLSGQLSLGEWVTPEQEGAAPAAAARQVAAHTRRASAKQSDSSDDSLPFFDASKVPIEVIELTAPEAAGLAPEEFEVISYKNSYRLAQRPGSTVVLHYRRPVIKLKQTQAIVCPAAPVGVIEGSRAEVSFLAGLLVDKFAYHLPFYRQHQRLTDAGITVSRPWLTQVSSQAIALLQPIYEAQFDSIRGSRVKAMDETPIKAARAGPGKLKAAYFWPVYGELDEVCFPFFESRQIKHVQEALGLTPVERGVLLTDGYSAYEHYTKKTGLTHAQCWAHTRRHLFEAKDSDPALAAQGLDFIGGLYAVEERIREQKLSAAKKLDYRLQHAKPLVDQFFGWVNEQFEAQGLLPSSPLTKALAYARERRFGLEVYLTDPEVPIDTNHLERALRVIPMGRRNWLFCWTELGAKQVGIMQSLIVTCRLHGIDPYEYLVDVLQRVGQHPASRVHELTPRLWKQHFADQPLRSALHSLRT